ncbi:MAG: AAA family ATPase [Candidatus Peregrinibacteria bacterium]|nr:AAA family ATPase [Candidatus Peregrinibacteria bacterium]
MIIGLTGPMASGKSTVVDALKNRGFKHFTLSDIVREECRNQGLEEVRDNLMKVGQGLREEFGAGVLALRALQKIEKEGENGNWIVDGIRNPAEVLELRNHPDFVLIANTAPEDLIVSRILSRKRSDDTLDETAIRAKLRREMGEGEPPEGQQVQKCIDLADHVFENTMPMNEVEDEFMKLYNRINEQES